MSKQTKDKIIQIETTTDQNGSIKKQSKKVIVAQEPNYIKIYIDTILVFKSLPKQMNALLFELLKLMSFADPTKSHGGQLIGLTTFIKKEITEQIGIKMTTLDMSLTKFVKSGILKRLSPGTYQANPEMFGRGQWIDIKAIRATFDFNAQTVVADIKAEEDV